MLRSFQGIQIDLRTYTQLDLSQYMMLLSKKTNVKFNSKCLFSAPLVTAASRHKMPAYFVLVRRLLSSRSPIRLPPPPPGSLFLPSSPADADCRETRD